MASERQTEPRRHHLHRGDPAPLYPHHLAPHLRGDAQGRTRPEDHLLRPLLRIRDLQREIEEGLKVMESSNGAGESSELVTESGNLANIRQVAVVDVALAGADHSVDVDVELVDTAGHQVGVRAPHRCYAMRFPRWMPRWSSAVADTPTSAAERDLLLSVHALALWTVVVVNKADRAAAAELDEAVPFTASVSEQAEGTSAWEVLAWACEYGSRTPDSALSAEEMAR